MPVAINLPSDVVARQTADVIEREMRISYALALFKAARVTLSKAAELADMNIYDFIPHRIALTNGTGCFG